MNPRLFLALMLSGGALAGCDETSTPAGPAAWPAVEDRYALTVGGWTMKPAEETTKCVVVRLDNADSVWVSEIKTALARGSHHLVVYRSDATEERREPFDCQPFLETLTGTTAPLMISQIAEEVLTMPEGVAMRFAPRQMIRLEAHYLNYFPDDIVAQGEVTFGTVPEDRVVHEANLLFYGNAEVQLPPGSSVQGDWAFLDVPEGKQVFAVTGHTHQFGTNVEIEHVPAEAATAAPIYPDREYVWDDPPVTQYDPPLTFGQGGGFRYRCSWTNTSDEHVRFGESANAEMCFLWAYYYPSDGYRICINTAGRIRDLIGPRFCCPDDAACDAFGAAIEQFLAGQQ